MGELRSGSSVEEHRFRQVSEERRAAIVKKMPKFLLAFLISGGLLFVVRYNASDALSKSTDADHQIKDSFDVDRHFLGISIYIFCSIFIAEAMMIVQLPVNDCTRKFVVGIFVFIRLLLVVGLFAATYLFFHYCVAVIKFVQEHLKNIGSPQENNHVNFYMACGIAIVMIIFDLILVLLLIYAIFRARHLCSAIKNFGVFFINFVKDYIYPEDVRDEHIKGLYSEEAEKIRMTGLLNESKEAQKVEQVQNYLGSRQRALSTFRELVCPKCDKDLEDGDTVIEVECTAKHNYHESCLRQYLKEKEEQGVISDFKCLGCDETVAIAVNDEEVVEPIIMVQEEDNQELL